MLAAGVALLLITGLLGGIGGATRVVVELPKDFLIGGAGGVWTLCARIIVATFEAPVVIGDEFESCRRTWPGDIERAIPVAKNDEKLVKIS